MLEAAREVLAGGGVVKAAVVHNGLANLQTSAQDKDARPGLYGSQGEQWALCVRNEARGNTAKQTQVGTAWMSEQPWQSCTVPLHGAWI